GGRSDAAVFDDDYLHRFGRRLASIWTCRLLPQAERFIASVNKSAVVVFIFLFTGGDPGLSLRNRRPARANANRAFQGASAGAFAGCRVLPVEEPQAFVLGMLKPRVYLSQGLLETLSPDDLRLVLAHEKAHARRRDPLRRFVAAVGLLFHLPGI